MRELENVIERAVVLTSGPRIGIDLIPEHVRKAPNFAVPQFVVPPEGISFKDVITDFEKRLIESTLEAAGGVQKKAAELLHIKPTTLNEMIKRYDIRPRRKRQGAGERRSARPVTRRSCPKSRRARTASVPRVPDLREDPFELAEHDVPPVVAPHVVAAVSPERLTQTLIARPAASAHSTNSSRSA